MANLSSTSGTNGATTSQVNEVYTDANQIFNNVNHLLTHEMHQEEHLDSDVELDIDDNTILYHQYQLDSDVQDVPTKVSSTPPGEISMITILYDLRTQLDGHLKVNQEQSLVNDSLRTELARCKHEMVSLECNKVKHDLDQTIIQHNKRNAELEEENVLLKSKLSQNVVSINSLKNESKKVVSDKKVIEDKIPWNLKQAKLSRPTLYDGHALLNTTHSPVRVNDSEDALVQAEVSRAKMSERPGTIKPINYAELNALYSHFVPQKELSREQVYWLPAEEIASQNTFETIIKRRTTPTFHEQGEWRFVHTKKAFTEQVIPFYEHVKELVQSLDENLVKEVTEFMRIFDELDTEYEQCVLEKKNLQIEKKNLLIQNECLITDSIAKDICSIVLASDRDRPLSEELSSNCVRENSKVIELEAEILNQQRMLAESDKRCSFLQKNHIDLQVKFQKYKECFKNQTVGDNSHSPADNTVFEINQLKEQLQGKDDTIRKLQTQINSMSMLNVGPTVGSFDKQALETELTQLKDAITSVRIQNDGFKVENENVKRRYKELSETNTHSRDALTGKITALTAENAKLKTELISKISSGSIACEKPKVLAPGMYAISPKYIPPQRRVNRVVPTPLPKKKQVTFQEPPRTSNRPTQKPPVQQNKKPNVPVNLSTRTKPATESRKPMPKSHTRNHRILPSKSVNAKHSVNHTKKVWKATRNHNVHTTKTAWRPTGKVIGSVKPQWKPIG
ncbi:hypothetical protein Tco_0605798 [Tanacetum coccineum]